MPWSEAVVGRKEKYYAKQHSDKLNHVFSLARHARREMDLNVEIFICFKPRDIFFFAASHSNDENLVANLCAGCKKNHSAAECCMMVTLSKQFCTIWNITQGHEKRAIYFSLGWHKHEKRFVDFKWTSIWESCLWSKITTFPNSKSAPQRFVTQRAQTSSVGWETSRKYEKICF